MHFHIRADLTWAEYGAGQVSLLVIKEDTLVPKQIIVKFYVSVMTASSFKACKISWHMFMHQPVSKGGLLSI